MGRSLTHATISRYLNPGRYFDSTQGLHLYVKSTGRKSWVFRYTKSGKRRDLGLGPYPAITLSEARDRALELRRAILNGTDPFAAKQMKKQEGQPQAPVTFADFAEEFITLNEPQWQNLKHIAQWRYSLREFAYPVIGRKTLPEIDTNDLLSILAPIWKTKTETASRLRGRIERVIAAAITRGLRSGPNPAIWRGHLDTVLPKASRIKRVKHHAALPHRDLPALIAEIHSRECASALALEFLILTAARSGEVRYSKWGEIQGDLWVIPAERTKMRREHRVPLCDRAQLILKLAIAQLGQENYIFHRSGKPLSNVAMSHLLERLRPGYTVHGFRSTFRDWVSEDTDHSGEVAEMALAHQIENRVEAAYRRGDLLTRRRRLMDDWEKHCLSNRALTANQPEPLNDYSSI